MKFIIVYDGKKETEILADWLKAEVSKNDSIETAKWSKKQYKDNEPTLSSNEYIVFIGNTETAKNISQSPSFEVKYNELNMKYGWLGKQAVLSIDLKYKFDEEKVNQFSNLYNKTFEQEIKAAEKINADEETKGIAGIVSKLKKTGNEIPVTGIVAAGVLVYMFGLVGVAVTAGTYFVGKNHLNQIKLNTDARKLLLQEFIKNGLNKFLKIEDVNNND